MVCKHLPHKVIKKIQVLRQIKNLIGAGLVDEDAIAIYGDRRITCDKTHKFCFYVQSTSSRIKVGKESKEVTLVVPKYMEDCDGYRTNTSGAE